MTTENAELTQPTVPTSLLIRFEDDNSFTADFNQRNTTFSCPDPEKLAPSAQTDKVTIKLLPGQPALFYDVGFRMPYNPGLLTHRIDSHVSLPFLFVSSLTGLVNAVFSSLYTAT